MKCRKEWKFHQYHLYNSAVLGTVWTLSDLLYQYCQIVIHISFSLGLHTPMQLSPTTVPTPLSSPAVNLNEMVSILDP